jgi:hypothetical protein
VKPSPALVVACVALLVSLTGTGVAAVSQLGKGTVGAPQLRSNAVTSQKVANGSLLRADVGRGQFPVGRSGPRGLTGPAGATGAPGPVGPTTVYHAQFVHRSMGTPLPPAGTTRHTLTLPAGSYLATAAISVRNNNPGDDGAACELVPSTGDVERFVQGATAGQQGELTGTAAFTLAGAGSVALRCMGIAAGGQMARNGSTLTAVKVGEVVQQ